MAQPVVGSTMADSEVKEGSLGSELRWLVRRLQNVGESRQTDRQRRELEQLMGLPIGVLRPVEDTDVDMQEQGFVGSGVAQGDVGSSVVGSGVSVDGSMQVDGDLGETTLDLGARGTSRSVSEVNSASVVSFTDGLPQGEPTYQRQMHNDVDALVASMD